MPRSDAPSHEARLLAQLLQSGRVVLLLGEPLADRSGLIRRELVPLLNTPAPGGSAPASRTVVFDNWSDADDGPLPRLRLALAQALGLPQAELAASPAALADALAAWTQARPTQQLLLLLDRFEDHLLAPRPGPAHAQLTHELVRVLSRPGLPVSVLLSLSEAAQPQLSGMRGLVPGLEDMSLRLKSARAGADAGSTTASAGAALPDPSAMDKPAAVDPQVERTEARRAASDKPPLRSGDVYELIHSTLSRVATGNAANPMLDGRLPGGEPEIETFKVPPSEGPEPTWPDTASTDTADARNRWTASSFARARRPWWQRLIAGLRGRP